MSGNTDFPDKARARRASGAPLSVPETKHFDKLLHLFCANRRGTHGHAESSITNYRGCMKRVVRTIGLPPWAWEAQDIDLLLDEQAQRGVTTGSQLGIITILRGFQGWLLADVGLCNEIQREFGFRPQRFISSSNSIPHRRTGRNRSQPVTPLSAEQCAALLDEFRFQIEVASRLHTKSYQPRRRDYAITVLALSYGLRADEIAGIELNHFFADPKYEEFREFALLRVIGKGSQVRTVRLYVPLVADVLQWYIAHVRPAFLSERTQNPNLLFHSERGCKLSARQYRRSLASVAASAGLPMHVHPHLLRHTYATQMAQTIGVRALQEQLGHKHISTTLGIYYHQDPEQVGNEVLLGIEAVTAAFEEITQEAQDAQDANRR